MGCDGGTIPRRDELVKLKKKPEQKDKDAERRFKWRNCALSQQPLQEPIVACSLGRLYSKSCVIESLLDKEAKPASISHINGLKDIKDLKLTKNPAYVETEHLDGIVGDGSVPYICPISGIEMAGKFRFIFLWSCGCVLAERALKEVKQNLCHLCQEPFTDNDVVVLNGTEEDIKKLEIKMSIRLANRKTKKSKQPKVETITEAGPSTSQIDLKPNVINEEQEPKETESSEPAVKKELAVKKEVDTIPLALPKFDPNKKTRGHFGSSKRAYPDQLSVDPSYKKSKKDYSVAQDPQASEVYKSIFTSHQDEKDQKRAHWVTYNPFYN